MTDTSGPSPAVKAYKRTQTVQLIVALAECYAVAEITWHVLHDNEQWLYEAVLDKLDDLRRSIMYRAQVIDTLRQIRRLPE